MTILNVCVQKKTLYYLNLIFDDLTFMVLEMFEYEHFCVIQEVTYMENIL